MYCNLIPLCLLSVTFLPVLYHLILINLFFDSPGHLVFEDLLASQIDTPVTIPIPVPTAGSVSTDIGLTMVNSQNIPFDRIESSSSNSSSTNGDCISVSASFRKDALHDWWMKLQASTIDL